MARNKSVWWHVRSSLKLISTYRLFGPLAITVFPLSLSIFAGCFNGAVNWQDIQDEGPQLQLLGELNDANFTASAGQVISPAPQVEAFNPTSNSLIANQSFEVNLYAFNDASCSPAAGTTGTLLATTNTVNGIATFSNLKIDTAQVYYLQAAAVGLADSPCSPGIMITNYTAPTGLSPLKLIAHPTRKWLYAVNSTGKSISQYAVSSTTGGLAPLPVPTVATSFSPINLAIEPTTGKWAYVSEVNTGATSDSIWQYSIDPSSGLLSGGTQYNESLGLITAIQTDSYQHLFVVAGGNIYLLNIGVKGTLSDPFLIASTSYSEVSKLAVVPTSGTTFQSSIYVGSGHSSTLSSLVFSASPSPLATATATPIALTAPVIPLANSAGNILYVTSAGNTGKIYAYPINSEGVLNLTNVSNVALSAEPVDMIIDVTGKWLYVLDSQADKIIGLSIGANGSLVNIGSSGTTASVSTGGSSPVSITSVGGYVYVLDSSNNNIRTFKINTASGVSGGMGSLTAL